MTARACGDGSGATVRAAAAQAAAAWATVAVAARVAQVNLRGEEEGSSPEFQACKRVSTTERLHTVSRDCARALVHASKSVVRRAEAVVHENATLAAFGMEAKRAACVATRQRLPNTCLETRISEHATCGEHPLPAHGQRARSAK